MAGARISATAAFAGVQDIVRRMPDKFRDEFIAVLRELAPGILARERAGVPNRRGARPAKFAASRPGLRPSGGLASLLSTSLDEKDLRLNTGLIGHAAREQGFYGYILDAGRGIKRSMSRPRVRQITGSKHAGRFGSTSRYTKPYSRRISPISPGRYDITFGRVRAWVQQQAGPALTRVYERALVAVAWGRS